MRIEVGRGLEGVITDLTSQRIIDENLTPNFRNEKYAEGFMVALERMSPLLRGEILELPKKKMFDIDNPEDIQALLIFAALLGW
jgi:uncharacterized protein